MTIASTEPDVAALSDALTERIARGERFAGLFASRRETGGRGVTVTLSALPPSGIFRSECQIVAGGLDSGGSAAAAVLMVLVTLTFFGLATSATRMLLSPARDAPGTPRIPPAGEPSAWMVVPVLAGVAAAFLLGIHPPGELTSLITQAAAQLHLGAS